MVTIEYYENPLEDATSISHHETVADWIKSKFTDKSEIQDLRFFVETMIGDEIDVSDIRFLKIDSGTVIATPDSAIPREPATLIYLVVSIAISVAVQALTPKPEVPDSSLRNQNSATNSLGSRSNEPRINQRIDDIFGFVSKHTPPLIQFPYRRYINNQEVEFLYLCIGRGRYKLDEKRVFDGDTLLSRIPGAGAAFYEPFTSPNSSEEPFLKIGNEINEPLLSVTESNEISDSTELQPPNDLDVGRLTLTVDMDGNISSTTPDELDFNDYYKVGDEISFIDLYSYSFSRQEEVYPGEFWNLYAQHEIDGVYELTEVNERSLKVSIPTSEQSKWDNFGNSTSSTLRTVWLYNQTSENLYSIIELYGPAEIYFTQTNYTNLISGAFSGEIGPIRIPDNTDLIIINVFAPNGCYKTDGNDYKITIDYEYTVYEIDEFGNRTGESESYPFSISSNQSNTRAQAGETHEIIPPYYHNEIVGIRKTPRDKSGSVSAVDEIFWKNLYIANRINDNDFGDVTTYQAAIPANSTSLSVKDRKQNLDVTRKITKYLGDGQFGEKESFATDDFSQIIIHMALDKFIGRLTIDDINADGFIETRDRIVEYFNSDEMVRFGYDFDSDELTFQESFALIANVINCSAYTQSGVFDLFFEKEQNESSKLITHRNKIIGSEKRTVSFISNKNYDGVEFTYRDQFTAIDETIYIPEDKSATNPDKVECPGCITYEQAYKRAMRIRNKQIYSYINHIFDVDEFGRIILPGERIDSPDGTRFTERQVENGYRIYDGEIVNVNGLSIELSQPVKFTENETHIIQFTKSNGDNSEMINCSRGVDDFTINLDSLPRESIYDGYSKDRTKYIFASEQARQALPLLVQTIESTNDDGQEINTVSCINYSNSYYKNDKDLI